MGGAACKRYYDKLLKSIALLTCQDKDNQFGMRWRMEKEVVSGKGQFACANKKCDERKKLRTWEVNFGYFKVSKEKKNAFNQYRLCFKKCSTS